MERIYKFELKRAIKTPGFLLSLIIGNIICFLYWIRETYPLSQKLNECMAYDYAMKYPMSMFDFWIGVDSTQYAYTFFLLLPILATLPFGTSFFTDMSGRYINFICSRCDKRQYMKAKYFATTLSGGLVCVIPLIVNIMLTMLVMPCVKPEAATYNNLVQPKTSFSYIYYEYPWMFIILSLIIIFIYGAVVSGFALAVSFYTGNRIVVMMAPFILNIFLMMLSTFTGCSQWQPVYFIHPGYPSPRLLPFIIETLAIFVVSWWLYYVMGREDDIC